MRFRILTEYRNQWFVFPAVGALVAGLLTGCGSEPSAENEDSSSNNPSSDAPPSDQLDWSRFKVDDEVCDEIDWSVVESPLGHVNDDFSETVPKSTKSDHALIQCARYGDPSWSLALQVGTATDVEGWDELQGETSRIADDCTDQEAQLDGWSSSMIDVQTEIEDDFQDPGYSCLVAQQDNLMVYASFRLVFSQMDKDDVDEWHEKVITMWTDLATDVRELAEV